MSECIILSILDLSPADAAVDEVKDGKFFFAVETPIKEGTMPTVVIVPGNDNYPAGFHAGDAGGLDAIDTDLAPGNIKKNIVIFGKTGTLEPIEDILGVGSPYVTSTTGGTFYRTTSWVDIGADFVLTSLNQSYDALSLAVGFAVIMGAASAGSGLKLRLIMGGVQVAETGFIGPTFERYVAKGTKVLSGAQTCDCRIHNYAGAAIDFYGYGNINNGQNYAAVICVGSVKL